MRDSIVGAGCVRSEGDRSLRLTEEFTGKGALALALNVYIVSLRHFMYIYDGT